MNQSYQTSPDLPVSGLSANCQLVRVRHTPMNRRHFLLLLTSMLSTSFTIVGARTTYASSNDDDDDDDHDEDDDHDDNEDDDEPSDEQESPTQPTSEFSHEDDEEENHEYDDSDGVGHAGDHQQALEAVRSNEAIPFRDIIEIFRKQFDGKIVDASIYQKRGQLVYRFKYVDQSGHVLVAFYQAATGVYLGT